MNSLQFKNINKILIIRKHNQIGDLIVSIPMFYALKKHFPGSQITLLASKTNYEIPFKEINPYIDNVISFDRSSLKKQIKLIKTLRKIKFDLAIIPSTIRFSTTSILISYLSNIKYRVGVESIDNLKNKFSFLLNIKRNFYWKTNKVHQTFRNLEVIKQIGCEITIKEIFESFPRLNENEKNETQNIFNENHKSQNILIGVHPGAGKLQNIWKTENFLSVIKYLYKKYNSSFIITSGPNDENVTKHLVLSLNDLKIPFYHAKNLPFKKLLALINYCDLFISNDTGVMHIAGLTDTILIALGNRELKYEWAPLWKNKFYLCSPTNNINDIEVKTVIDFCDKMINVIMYKKKLA